MCQSVSSTHASDLLLAAQVPQSMVRSDHFTSLVAHRALGRQGSQTCANDGRPRYSGGSALRAGRVSSVLANRWRVPAVTFTRFETHSKSPPRPRTRVHACRMCRVKATHQLTML